MHVKGAKGNAFFVRKKIRIKSNNVNLCKPMYENINTINLNINYNIKINKETSFFIKNLTNLVLTPLNYVIASF